MVTCPLRTASSYLTLLPVGHAERRTVATDRQALLDPGRSHAGRLTDVASCRSVMPNGAWSW